MGQIVGPWESQEGRSLYLPHPQLRIAHPDHGKSFTKSSLRSHIFAPSPVLYSYGSRRTTWLLIRQSNPLYLDGIVSIFFVLLFFSVIPLYLLSPLTRYTHTYLSTDVVVRQILVFLFSLFFSRCLTDLVMSTNLHCRFHLCYLLYAKLCILVIQTCNIATSHTKNNNCTDPLLFFTVSMRTTH